MNLAAVKTLFVCGLALVHVGLAGIAVAQDDAQPAQSDPCGISRAQEESLSNSDLQRCAEQGVVAAQSQLGLFYWGAALAVHCYGATCTTGDPEQYGLSAELSLEALQSEGRRLLEAAAEAGDAVAQNELGYALLRGEQGLESDPQRALNYLMRASEGGDALAPYSLAQMYFGGYGVPVSTERGEAYLRLSAERGSHEAQCSLARWLQRLPEEQRRNERPMPPDCNPAEFIRELPLIDTDQTL